MTRCRILSVAFLGVTRAYMASSYSTYISLKPSQVSGRQLQREVTSRNALGGDGRCFGRGFEFSGGSHPTRRKDFRIMSHANDDVPRRRTDRPKDPFLPFAAAVIPTLLARGASASLTEVSSASSEMGARLDGSAAVSFGVIVVSFFFLQARIRKAAGARTARREYEKVLRDTQSKRLSGMASEEDVLLAEKRMAQLVAEEQDTRKLDILGVPFNIVLPDGGAGSALDPGGRGRELDEADRGSSSRDPALGAQDAIGRNAETDPGYQKGRDDTSPIASLKVAGLWLVLISQLWLLLVLWNDPMGPATSTFLQD